MLGANIAETFLEQWLVVDGGRLEKRITNKKERREREEKELHR